MQRTELKTSRGTVFPIVAETNRYVLCERPAGRRTKDFAELRAQGLTVRSPCDTRSWWARLWRWVRGKRKESSFTEFVVFEKVS